MKSIVILDGYNVINRCWELIAKEKVSLQTARVELIGWIVEYQQKRHNFEVIIVFDGKEDVVGNIIQTPPGVSVMFANETADTRITEIVRKNPNPKMITVVTDDNEVINAVKNLGAKIKSVGELINLIHLPKTSSGIPEKPTSSDPQGRAINEELKRRWNIK